MPVTFSRLKIPAKPAPIHVLVTEALGATKASPVLLFLHGKDEFGPSADALPLVLRNMSPAFQAIQERLQDVTIVSPQFPSASDQWNWETHVKVLGKFLRAKFKGRRLVATGFSRGGLGVLQMVAANKDLIALWAIVDPQRAEPDKENGLLPKAPGAPGWLRFGNGIAKNTLFAARLGDRLDPKHAAFVNLAHGDLAIAAYSGDKLHGFAPLQELPGDAVGFTPPATANSKADDRQTLYEYLGLKWK